LKDNKKIATLQYNMEKENVDFITIKKDPTSVTFSFETDGSFTTKDAIKESIKILEKKYTEFSKLLKGL
jgi:DNA-directed RNA polymerase alpha subunit